MATHRYPVAETEAGSRLDRFVAGLPQVGSRRLAEQLIAAGAVSVDGRTRPKSHLLVTGAEVSLEVPDSAPAPESAPVDVNVVHEDEHLMIVDKPAGLVVHPGAGHVDDTLARGVAELGAEGGEAGREGIVHRLDRDTSGLLVVARSPEVHERLAALVRDREVVREYLALVKGTPRSRTGRIDAPIGRDRRHRSRMSLDTETPREAVTWFEVLEQPGERALLQVRLETGRTHQIRVHLAAIDLPVCGDPVYGVAGDLGLERQFLHACRLRFEHPVSGDVVDISSPLPADLTAALAAARGAS